MQESESKTLKSVGVYSAEAGAVSESKISDSAHLCYIPAVAVVRNCMQCGEGKRLLVVVVLGNQARRQDLAAGAAKNQEGAHF